MDQDDLAELFEQEQIPDSSPASVPEPGVPVQKIEVFDEDDDEVLMTDDEIMSILSQHIRNAVNWYGSEIAAQQAKAMEYYLGMATGDLAPPGVQGRSQYVDTTVSDQIEWMMPQLMEKFFASPNMILYDPRKRGDEQGAKQMTALMNYTAREQNEGFRIFQDWFKNSLLNKVGVAKVWWETSENIKKEFYDNLTDGQLAVLKNDPEIQIRKIISYVDPNAERAAMDQFKQQSAAWQQWQQAQKAAKAQGLPFPPPVPNAPPPPPGQPPQVMQPPPRPQPINLQKLPQLHNVVAVVTDKAGRVTYDAMNSEDFLIERKSKRIEDGFSAHRIKRTISYLRQQGYANVDKIDLDTIQSNQDAEANENSQVQLAREALQNTYIPPNATDDYGDPSMREVWLFECYLPIDCDMDGIAEWRKITIAGNAILENVSVDGPPFADLCPCPIPGLFYGRGLADLGMPTQYVNTGLTRSLIDNVNVQVNGRTWAIESQVNISDLLTNRPGGVVRVKSANAVGALQQGLMDGNGAYQLLQFMDDKGSERAGITKYTQGMDADSLNHTATGIKSITSRADMRVQLVARSFAETGVKKLFSLIQKEMMRHQDQRMTFQVNGNWTDVDPRVWHNQYIMRANVGLGTGDQGQKVAGLMQLGQVQQALLPMGMVTPENMFNSASDLVDALQLGVPERYFTPLQPGQQPPQKPDPNMALVQGQLALEQAKGQNQLQLAAAKQQGDQALAEMKAQLDDAEKQRQAAYERETLLLREQLIDARERDKQQSQIALEQWKYERNMQFEMWKFAQSLTAQRTAAAEKSQTDAATEIAMNHTILADVQGNQAAVPNDLIQQHMDNAEAERQRQHEAQLQANQHAHDAVQAHQDRVHQAAQQQAAQEAAAQQAADNAGTKE